MTNRILIIVTIIFFVLLALSAGLIYLVVTSPLPIPGQLSTPEEVSAISTEVVSPSTTSTSQESFLSPTIASTNTSFPEVSATLEAIVSSQATNVIEATLPPPTETFIPTETTSKPMATATRKPTPSVKIDMQCKNTGSYTTSLIVEDSNTNEPPFGAELIRLARIDFDNQQFVLVPLSSYLELSAKNLLQTYGISKSTLGIIYHTEYQRTIDSEQRHDNASLMVNQVIKENFNISPDYYISLNQNSLKQLVKFTGSIEINNPESFSTDLYEYSSGNITIDSSNIWDYLVYNKDTSGEFSRLIRQDILLEALFSAIRTTHSLSELDVWMKNHQDLITTNMDNARLVNTFCALGYSDEGILEFAQIPADNFTINPETITMVDPNQVIDFIDQRLSTGN